MNFQSLSYDSVYLMNDGFDLMMYVGSDVHANLLNKLFGVSTIDQIYNGYPEVNYLVSEDFRNQCSLIMKIHFV